jgi:SpoIID/LytB domain protein
MQEPILRVGILSAPKIKFELNGDFIFTDNTDFFSGVFSAEIKDNKIVISGNGKKISFEQSVTMVPDEPETEFFTLRDVMIGVKFHWERLEKQSFKGSLLLVVDGKNITAINLVSAEEYLMSVISSEMSSKSTLDLLKAHAVISRSWTFAQIEKAKTLKTTEQGEHHQTVNENEIIRWYDRDDHTLFDVCADDHCQRYQGITKIFTDISKQAVQETRGLVLMFDDSICDTRFSKSCGGISEYFENLWEPVHYPYLIPVIDYKYEPDNFNFDFTNEKNAEKWIKGNPPSFCNTTDKIILSQILLDYDQETTDFYRWTVYYTQEEVSNLLKEKLGIDFGEIIDFIPVERGASARLIKLKIVGTKKTVTIGKELEIRRALSKTHLYSSAIIFEKKEPIVDRVPAGFILHGAGWGHGAGLCQIGAAVMAVMGYRFDEILLHYYKNAAIKKIY